LEDLAKKGVLVILVSSDLQELIRVSSRILIMRKGRIVSEFVQDTVTQDDILASASGFGGREAGKDA
jgi:ribose transport system ATP-binding protein